MSCRVGFESRHGGVQAQVDSGRALDPGSGMSHNSAQGCCKRRRTAVRQRHIDSQLSAGRRNF
jgi:hypothetical protein